MKQVIFFIIMLSLFFSSCSEDNVETYGDVQYVYFSDTTTNYTFAFDPHLNSQKIPIVIKLIGNQTTYDRDVNITVESTNVTDSHFEILSPKLRAGMYLDTIYIRINKSEDKDQIGYIRFVINGNDYFTPGPTKSAHFSLTFSDILLKPEWWDNTVEKDYLGIYSEKKYREFIKATGVNDLTDMGSSEKRAYTLMFKTYIIANDLKEEDGSPMLVTIKQ